MQKTDPNFNVYIGQVGYWLPWDPRADAIEGQEYAETELNELVKKYKDNQTNKDIHFRENIEYVKEQQRKANLKSLDTQDTTETVDSIPTPVPESSASDAIPIMNDTDPWLQRKQEAKDIVSKELSEQSVAKNSAEDSALEVALLASKAAEVAASEILK